MTLDIDPGIYNVSLVGEIKKCEAFCGFLSDDANPKFQSFFPVSVDHKLAQIIQLINHIRIFCFFSFNSIKGCSSGGFFLNEIIGKVSFFRFVGFWLNSANNSIKKSVLVDGFV